jgi:hypothetical protein
MHKRPDIVEYWKQFFLASVGGSDHQQSLEYSISSFSPVRDVEASFQTEIVLNQSEKSTGA